mmetsp:Transcript_8247/g.26340  ORF Transcript_8247/g.26340 Transcript_8247/m.26340 type:complete len:223 (+) Transcript_8247:499-1167(+)
MRPSTTGVTLVDDRPKSMTIPDVLPEAWQASMGAGEMTRAGALHNSKAAWAYACTRSREAGRGRTRCSGGEPSASSVPALSISHNCATHETSFSSIFRFRDSSRCRRTDEPPISGSQPSSDSPTRADAAATADARSFLLPPSRSVAAITLVATSTACFTALMVVARLVGLPVLGGPSSRGGGIVEKALFDRPTRSSNDPRSMTIDCLRKPEITVCDMIVCVE